KDAAYGVGYAACDLTGIFNKTPNGGCQTVDKTCDKVFAPLQSLFGKRFQVIQSALEGALHETRHRAGHGFNAVAQKLDNALAEIQPVERQERIHNGS